MLIIVFDINVLVSSLIVKGKPQDLWQKAKDKDFTLAFSREMLTDLVKVLRRKKFEKYVTNTDIQLFSNDLQITGKLVPVKSTFRVVAEDPDDDIIIRAAHDVKADYIVSGDRHLLALKEFKGIRIVTVDQMLVILNSKRY
ncbi:MAG: putative toxin-antitoxin system toxin component, PIN family [Crenarchaeota archaeon]|nr:putative toxin-antitoxin system toxin component, PIN family [Thermoproteota archaeon]